MIFQRGILCNSLGALLDAIVACSTFAHYSQFYSLVGFTEGHGDIHKPFSARDIAQCGRLKFQSNWARAEFSYWLVLLEGQFIRLSADARGGV